MPFEYKMVQIPPNIEIRGSGQGSEAADYLQRLVNSLATKGWEFQRVDTVGVRETPGCIAGLLGQTSTFANYYVVTFRRESRPTLASVPDPGRTQRKPHSEPISVDRAEAEDEDAFEDDMSQGEPSESDEESEATVTDEVTCLKCGATLGEFDEQCPKCGWSYRSS